MPIIMLNESYEIELSAYFTVYKTYRPTLSEGLRSRLQHLKDETDETLARTIDVGALLMGI